MSDRDTEALIAVLQDLPEGQVVHWNDSGHADGMYLGAFLDVFADPVCHTLEWGWAWCVKDPDVDWDDPPEIADILIPRDATYTEPENGDEYAAWHPETISGALEAWVSEYAGRSDVRFEHTFDLYTPMQAWVDEIEEERKAGLLDFVPAEAVFPELRPDDDSDAMVGIDTSKRYEVRIERRLAEWLTGPPDLALLEELERRDDEDDI